MKLDGPGLRIMLFLVLFALSAFTLIFADDSSKLIGEWQSAQGDVVKISTGSDGRLIGRLLKAAPDGLGRLFTISVLPLMVCSPLEEQFKCNMQIRLTETRNVDEVILAMGNATLELSADGNQLSLHWVPKLHLEKSAGGYRKTLEYIKDDNPIDILLTRAGLASPEDLNVHAILFSSKASGEFKSFVTDGRNFNVHMAAHYGEGFQARGSVSGDSQSPFLSATSFEIDTNRGVASLDYVFSAFTDALPINTRIPAPTEQAIQSYLKALPPAAIRKLTILSSMRDPTRTAMVVPVRFQDAPEEPLEQRPDGPFVIWSREFDPYPGKFVEIWGRFPVPQKSISATIGGKQAEVKEHTDKLLLLKIPDDIQPGKAKVVVTIDGLVSNDGEIHVYPPGESPSRIDHFASAFITNIVQSILVSDFDRYIAGTAITFTRKQGKFRHHVLSADAEVEGSLPGEFRWVVVIDGELRNRLRDATFEIKVALVSNDPERVRSFLANLNDEGDFLVSVARLDIGKNERGQNIYSTRILHDGLAAALGISYNKDLDLWTLDEIFSLNLSNNGIRLGYDGKNKRLVLSAGSKDTNVELSADQNGIQLSSIESATRVYDGQLQNFTRTLVQKDGEMRTKLTFETRDGVNLDAPIVLQSELIMDDLGKDPGEPIPNVEGQLSYNVRSKEKEVGRISLTAEMKDSKLRMLRAGYQAFNIPNLSNAILEFSYQDLPDKSEKSWMVSGNLKGRLQELDLKFAVFSELEGRFNGDQELNSLHFTSGAEIETSLKSVELTFGVRGELVQQHQPERETRYRVSGFGMAEFKKIELLIEGSYGNLRGKDEAELSLGLDLGGLWKVAAKAAGQDKEQRWNLLPGDK